ncbi:MAG: transcriptional regulator [Planctomycetota bacterium]|nr:MAG: transcriptional regulator [Planctomycetota bacterium]
MDLLIETTGTVRCVFGEEIDLGQLGRLSIRRGSHVEPTPDGQWTADLAPVNGPLLGPFPTVALKIPNGVLCLISALAWHELTTQIPHEICVAIPRGAEPPRLSYPPVRHFWFSGPAYSEGIETHAVDGVPVRIYSREKTLADCFKHRNRIGLDTVLEALKAYRQQGRVNVESLLHYADICRVKRIIRPYLEAVL